MRNINKKIAVTEKVSITAMYSPILTDSASSFLFYEQCALCAFLEHGEIEISNNQVENAIRPLVVGRKNWLFSDTPEGAEASAIVYSLIETAKPMVSMWNGICCTSSLYCRIALLPIQWLM